MEDDFDLTEKESRRVSISSSDGELQARLQQVEELERQVRVQNERDSAAELERVERKRDRRLRREIELADLREEEKLLKKQIKPSRSQLPKKVATAASRPAKAAPVPAGAQAAPSQKLLRDQVAEHEARRQSRAADKRNKQREESSNLTIDGIRKLPDVRQKALKLMSELQGIIPSLAADPDAGTGSLPAGVAVTPDTQQLSAGQPSSRFVYVASLGRAIPVVDTPADISNLKHRQVSVDTESESECSEDEDCPLAPDAGQRFLWKRNPDGSKYFLPVPIKRLVKPALVWTYVLDSLTGRYERRQVPAQQASTAGKEFRSHREASKKSPSSPRYVDHRVKCGLAGMGGRTAGRTQRHERQPSYVCPETDSEKKGKESKLPEVVNYARDCPVSWTSKVTTEKINPILWSWAYMSQLLATRTGQAPALGDGELEARVQHFLSVLEIILQTTTMSDFPSEAWKVARLYHVKVQQKIDTGDYSWLQLQQQWGAATLPHELMAARAEIPVVVKTKRTDDTNTGRGGQALSLQQNGL